MKHQTYFDALTRIIEGACAYPDELRVYPEANGDHTTSLVVLPHMADYPKIVGKGGRTVNALKLLTSQASVRLGERIAFKLEESFVGKGEPRVGFGYNKDFDIDAFRKLLEVVAGSVFEPTPVFQITASGEDLFVDLMIERTNENETLVNALHAAFYPYGFAKGRIIKIRQRRE